MYHRCEISSLSSLIWASTFNPVDVYNSQEERTPTSHLMGRIILTNTMHLPSPRIGAFFPQTGELRHTLTLSNVKRESDGNNMIRHAHDKKKTTPKPMVFVWEEKMVSNYSWETFQGYTVEYFRASTPLYLKNATYSRVYSGWVRHYLRRIGSQAGSKLPGT